MSLLYEISLLEFLVVTCVLGGGAAFMAGRALAIGWRPIWQLVLYMVLLGLAVRFFHWALAEGTLLTLYFTAIDTLVLIGFGLLGYRITRTRQMVTQYRWLYRRTSPLTWAAREPSSPPSPQ